MTIRDYSQYGEQAILRELFSRLGIYTGVSLEFGGADATWASNTRYFYDEGWTSYFWDTEPLSDLVENIEVRPDNVQSHIDRLGITDSLNLLSIDIDGNDYWVWAAISSTPDVVVVEFNQALPADKAVTIKYDPLYRWDQTAYYGASWLAMKSLGLSKGYDLYAVTACNMIFVRQKFGLLSTRRTTYTPYPSWPADTKGREWVSVP